MAVLKNFASYASGINAAALPLTNIRPDELPLMVNATVRNGFAQTRPGWEWQPLSFFDADLYQYPFQYGKFQGCGRFLSNNGNLAVFVVDGRVFGYNPVTGYVQNYSLENTQFAPFSKFSPHAWVQQRGKWVIVQDGFSAPFRSDGVTSEQTLTVQNEAGVMTPSVPAGTVMAEGWHRLFVADPSRRRVYASDHDMDPNSTPISFTEDDDYFMNARYFEVPQTMGKIMGMAFPSYQDSSTGIGPLMVFCERGVQAYQVNVARTDWITRDITQTVLPAVGASSFYGYSDKGADLVFRDQEGKIRTIRNAQQFQAVGANYSNDFTVWPLYANEDASLREYSHSCTFDRRTLTLVHPQRKYLADNRFTVVHKAIAVMENEHLSDKPDVWSFWTGLNICGMVSLPIGGEEALLAFVHDPDGVNRIYRLTRTGTHDKGPSGRRKRIQMTLTTPRLDFENPMMPKAIQLSQVNLSGMQGQFTMKGRLSLDGSPPCDWFTHNANYGGCLMFNQSPCGMVQVSPGHAPRMVLESLSKDVLPYETEMTFDVFGPASFNELQIVAEPVLPPTTTNTSCRPKTHSAKPLCPVDPLCYDAFTAEDALFPSVPLCPAP